MSFGSPQFSQFSGVGAGAQYPDPWLDVASLSVPTNMRSALYWAEYIYSIFGTYRMAMERVISYFLTEVDVLNASDDEADKWKSYTKDVLGIMTVLQSVLRNRSCYGNAFTSLQIPFQRFLRCPQCNKVQFLLNQVYEGKESFNFEWQIPNFIASCPNCKLGSGYRGPWKIKDEICDADKKCKIKIWNPHQIEMLHCTYSEDVNYLWRIPEDYKLQIRQGGLYHLERVPEEVLKAIHRNQLYRFDPDAIFHMREPTLAGLVNRGWGLPRIISNFRQIWYVQVLRRFNEAIALDYVIPFRVITPAPATGTVSGVGGAGMSMDPISMYSGNDFRSIVAQMQRRRRRDPAAMQTLPFPVNFQMFGADANKLAPRELLDQATEQLLNDSGTPVELYNGSLQLQTAPVALRLFESTWRHLVGDANDWLAWLVRQITQVLSWETVSLELKRVTIADNLERQMMAAQLMMSQQLSGQTVLSELGDWNFKKEQQRISEEARFQSELQSRTQEEMQEAGFAQQVAKGQQDPSGGQGGGQGGGGGGQGDPSQQQPQGPVTQYLASVSPNAPQSPQDMMQVADSMAQQLLGLPEGVKDSELRKLLVQNKVLHDVVKERMQEIRNQTKSRAGAQAMGQMQQGGQGGQGGQQQAA